MPSTNLQPYGIGCTDWSGPVNGGWGGPVPTWTCWEEDAYDSLPSDSAPAGSSVYTGIVTNSCAEWSVETSGCGGTCEQWKIGYLVRY